ncbi:MAG: hypothetical protein KKH80_02050 [Candidatus Omnitrophica bacterium]|nr:hypothetical protein [Candidatus Omnitrophota bacterium]
MRFKQDYKILNIILFLALTLILPRQSFAAFSLSVTPYEGGYDLRYGKVSTEKGRINKEVIVRIASDINKQYRLTQVLQEPLSNAQGDRFAQNNFLVYAIRGTNRYGSLSVETETPVYSGRTVIYTSGQQGLSDSFTLVYSLQVPMDQEPGSYRGKLRFTLEPVDSTASSTTVILDILTEVEAEARIKLTTSSGGRIIELKSYPQEKSFFDVGIDVLGGIGRQFKFLQFLASPLISSEGNKLDLDLVSFSVQGGNNGIATHSSTALSSRVETLYTSGSRGEADSFLVTYNLGDLTAQKAGAYRGKIKYLLEIAGMPSSLFDTLDLEIDNPEVFELIITPQLGTGFLRFDNLKAGEPPRISEVGVEVKSNIARPYQVSQNISSFFTSKAGIIIPSEYFTLRSEPDNTRGRLRYSEKTAMRIGDMVLFVSDEKGSTDRFKVIYELSIPLDLKSGDYSTQITYSITAI